jgi:hypothetical protein
MLEYLKIINKNFQHKGYFSSLISRHQNLKTKSLQKKESFVKLGLIGVSGICAIGAVSFFVFFSIISLGIVLGCIPMCMILLLVKDFVGEQELKYMNQIESEFFSDLQNNYELIKDLSKLVIDDDTEDNFNDIVDNVLQDTDDDTFGSFHNLLYNYDCLQSEEDTLNERNQFLKGLKIDVRQNIEEEDTQESFQEKARERVMEML